MSFQFKFSKQATKFLKKLPKEIKERVKSKFRDIIKEPFRYLEHYEGDTFYKFRIGKYKALKNSMG